MTTLLFNHNGWTVTTSAWSAASKDGLKTEICYQWGADGISLFSSATGIRRVTLSISFDDFLAKVRMSGMADLR